MKRSTTLFVLHICLLGLISAHSQTPLYFNIISHNEITDPLDYANKEADYRTIQALVKELCDTIISKKAKYNMQIDANMIFGCLHYDDGANSPDDLLQWASQSDYIDVDGHNHFSPMSNPYNYADLAYLLDSCGVKLNYGVLGGVAYANITVAGRRYKETWTQYIRPKQGYTFKHFTWQADIVWGTATPGHVADYTSFGLWRPKGGNSPEEFGTHDPNQRLVTIGGGCKGNVGFNINPMTQQLRNTTGQIISAIGQVIEDIQAGPKTPNDFYTMNLLINFRDIPIIPHFADSIAEIIEGLQPYVDQGKLVWMTLAEKYDYWMEHHPDRADYFNLLCDEITLASENPSSDNTLQIFPNPFQNTLYIRGYYPKDARLNLYTLQGRKVHSGPVQSEIPLPNIPSGTYLLQIVSDANTFTTKLLKSK